MSEWTGEFSVGNRTIDSEHKKLYGMIYGSVCLAAARGATALAEAIEKLEGHLCDYFAIEERIAQAVNFDFSEHRAKHQQLLNEIKHMRQEISGCCALPEDKDYPRCLMNCLMKHVREDGKELKIVLETHLYDFNP